MRKCLYLSPRAKIERHKGTLFSQIFKVKENKVPLVFSILAVGLRYSHFLIFCQPHQQGAELARFARKNIPIAHILLLTINIIIATTNRKCLSSQNLKLKFMR